MKKIFSSKTDKNGQKQNNRKLCLEIKQIDLKSHNQKKVGD